MKPIRSNHITPILTHAHEIIKRFYNHTASHRTTPYICVDATCGNGYDTTFLIQCFGHDAYYYVFDIQEQAITATKERVEHTYAKHRIQYIHDSHERLASYIPKTQQIDVIIFNLGYLPKSDKVFTTQASSTCTAIQQAFELIAHGGLMIITCYTGHPEGYEEFIAVQQLISTFESSQATVASYSLLNKHHAPHQFIIEKHM